MKNSFYFLITLILSIFTLLGCATQPSVNINDPADLSKNIRIEYDDFKKHTKYTGMLINSGDGASYLIRAYKSQTTNEVKYQIYFTQWYMGDWRFYESAYDANGNSLPTFVIERKVKSCSTYGCSHTEDLIAEIDKNYLQKNSEFGINIRVYGKNGQHTFRIAPAYIISILERTK